MIYLVRQSAYLFTLFLMTFLTGCGSSASEEAEDVTLQLDYAKIAQMAQEANTFCTSRNLNTDFCIIIDLSMHSGLKRFFIWDFNQGSISDSFLVSHGSCGNPWSGDSLKEQAMFSNVNNSHCSSEGKYILGERGPSQWGIKVKYLMHGQDPTNSNATKRDIVFHSWERVSD